MLLQRLHVTVDRGQPSLNGDNVVKQCILKE